MRLDFALTLLAPFSAVLSRATILLFLLRLFHVYTPIRRLALACLILTILVFLPSIPISLIYMAPTRPGDTWEDLLYNGRPQMQRYLAAVQGPLAVVLDVWIFVLPLPVLGRVKVGRGRRGWVMVVFGTGLA
jgi:hypothetical protein